MGDILFYFILSYFWLRWVFVAAHELSLVAASGVRGLLIEVVSLVVEHRL